jgi:hypothetical protein
MYEQPQYDDTNKGVLFPTRQKKSARSPDYNGKLNIGGTEYWLSGWVRQPKNGGGSFISLSLGDIVQDQNEASQPPTQPTYYPPQPQPGPYQPQPTQQLPGLPNPQQPPQPVYRQPRQPQQPRQTPPLYQQPIQDHGVVDPNDIPF